MGNQQKEGIHCQLELEELYAPVMKAAEIRCSWQLSIALICSSPTQSRRSLMGRRGEDLRLLTRMVAWICAQICAAIDEEYVWYWAGCSLMARADLKLDRETWVPWIMRGLFVDDMIHASKSDALHDQFIRE